MTTPAGPEVAAEAGQPDTGPSDAGKPNADEPNDDGHRPAGRRRRGYWIPGLIALGVLLGIGLAFGAGDLDHGGPTTLAGPEIAQNLAQAIQAKEATPSLPAVRCPSSEPARAGLRFVCTVTLAGATRPVEVTEINGRGGLSWRLGS